MTSHDIWTRAIDRRNAQRTAEQSGRLAREALAHADATDDEVARKLHRANARNHAIRAAHAARFVLDNS